MGRAESSSTALLLGSDSMQQQHHISNFLFHKLNSPFKLILFSPFDFPSPFRFSGDSQSLVSQFNRLILSDAVDVWESEQREAGHFVYEDCTSISRSLIDFLVRVCFENLLKMIPVGGITCCLSAAALYLLGRSSGRDADVLRSVTRVNQLKDLAQLLDAASKVLPLVVSVSGRVGSDTPINCEYSGLRGVIVEQTAEQHFLKHNDAGSWIQDSALMLSMCKEVPWYLDDGTSRVHVVGARGATGLVLTVGSEVFEESGRSLVRGTLDYLQGLKMLGVKRIERVLPTGSPLTVVGEAVKDDIGSIRIQRPHKGPFYVSDKTIDQLIANLGKWSRLYKFAAVGLSVFGVYLLAKHAVQYIMERRRHWEMRKRVLAAAAAKKAGQEEGGLNGTAENGSDGTNKDRTMPDLCVICLEQEYNSVFVPCGHMCCCMTCSSHLTICPLCRRRIDQAVRTFRH